MERAVVFRLVGPHFCDLICVHKTLFYQKNRRYLQYYVLRDLRLLIQLFSSYMEIKVSQNIYSIPSGQMLEYTNSFNQPLV